MNIKDYLIKTYQEKTALSYLREWEHFKMYLDGLNINLQGVTYLLILDYVRQLQKQGMKPVSINRKLVVIEAVYEGLQLLADNPTRSFRVKRETRPSIPEPLKIEQLEALLSAVKGRDKVILSLIHHQALRLSEIKALAINNIDLENAILTIPSIRRSNTRELLLEARQIKLLDQYIKEIRPKLLQSKTNQLIVTRNGSNNVQNVFSQLRKKIQKQLPELLNLEHWRLSLIHI